MLGDLRVIVKGCTCRGSGWTWPEGHSSHLTCPISGAAWRDEVVAVGFSPSAWALPDTAGARSEATSSRVALTSANVVTSTVIGARWFALAVISIPSLDSWTARLSSSYWVWRDRDAEVLF